MIWEVLIRKCENGYVIRHIEESNEKIPLEVVFEEREDELEPMRNVLYYIKEYFGIYYSKHNKQNLVIKIEGQNECDS